MTRHIRYFIFMFVVLLLGHLRAGSMENLRWITLRDGLPGMSVTAFCEDTSGKMWIGTSNGVSLFNGISLRNYSLPVSDGESPSQCYDIALDADGNVWTVTRNGTYRLERHAEQFERVVPDLKYSECVLPVGDSVYIGSRTGLYIINRKSKGPQKPQAIDIAVDGVHENNVVRCLRYQNGRIWLTLRNSIVSIDHRTLAKTQHRFFQPSGLSRFDIDGNRLFVGTKNNGLYVLDIKTGENHRMEAIPNVVNDVHLNADGTLCVASDGNGAYLMDVATEQIVIHYCNDNADYELPSDVVHTFRCTKDNTSWIGMYLSGMVIGGRGHYAFSPYECGAFSTRGMKVTASLVDGNRMVVAVKGGFWLVDTTKGTATFHDTARMMMMHITNIIRYGDAYYIASYDGGLMRFDIPTSTLSRPSGYRQLEYASVQDMALSPDGCLWTATSEGIFIIGRDGAIKNYTEKNSRLPQGINSLYFDNTGNAWIGGSDKMCLWIADDGEFKTNNFPVSFFNTAVGLNFTGHGDSIYAWTPTALYRTNAAMSSFGEVTLPQGVLEEKCLDLAVDSGGVKYIVTERGMFRIDSTDGTMLHISDAWGISGSIVHTGTLALDSHHVWVATNDGLMMADKREFCADSLADIHMPIEADMVIVGSRELTNGEMLMVNDRRELRVEWNFIAQKVVLTPTPVDFRQHRGGIYEYRMDKDGLWRMNGMGQPVVMEGLTPGHHKLYIRMSGLESTTVGYDIYVYPSALFCVEMSILVLVLFLLYLWRRWRTRTNLLLREHIETESALIKEIKELTPVASSAAEMMPELLNKDAGDSSDGAKEENVKYRKSRSSDRELARLFRQMDEYVKQNKPYLNKDSKMSDIAAALGVSPSTLSQVFTLYLEEPYYDYINKYRLEEFKKLIRENKHKQFTITALSEQCGFKKTSFFSTFRKVEGTTPTEWIQKRTEKKS